MHRKIFTVFPMNEDTSQLENTSQYGNVLLMLRQCY